VRSIRIRIKKMAEMERLDGSAKYREKIALLVILSVPTNPATLACGPGQLQYATVVFMVMVHGACACALVLRRVSRSFIFIIINILTHACTESDQGQEAR